MPLERVSSPFAEEPLAEVPLRRTPLVTVFFQVRLPLSVSRLQAALASNELQTALAEEYPFAAQQESFNLVFQPGQPPMPQAGAPAWIMQSAGQDWTCNASADSIGLTTTAYVSRRDFVNRARRLLRAVEELTGPPRASRLGVRFVNRVPEPSRGGEDWIESLAVGARGILAATSQEERSNIVNTLTQVLYKWPDSQKQLQGRWGVLPRDSTIDAAIPAIPQESWMLDIDAFQEGDQPFHAESLAETMEDLAGRAYRFFRWVVTPESMRPFEPQGDA